MLISVTICDEKPCYNEALKENACDEAFFKKSKSLENLTINDRHLMLAN